MMNLNTLRRYQLRWAVLVALYNTRFEHASDSVLHTTLHGQWQATHKEIRAELDYLANAKLVVVDKHALYWQSHLTWHGVDVVEYTTVEVSGILRPDVSTESATHRHAAWNLRGCILDTLNAASTLGLNEGSMLEVVRLLDKGVTIAKLRIELGYLCSRGLVEIDKAHDYWVAKLTNFGTDVFLGTVPLLPGIALRPDCYA